MVMAFTFAFTFLRSQLSFGEPPPGATRGAEGTARSSSQELARGYPVAFIFPFAVTVAFLPH